MQWNMELNSFLFKLHQIFDNHYISWKWRFLKNLSKNVIFLTMVFKQLNGNRMVVILVRPPSFSIILRKSDVFSGEFWLHCTYTKFNEHRPVSLLTHYAHLLLNL